MAVFLQQEKRSLSYETCYIESGMFACAYLDDFDEEAEGAERLLAYCRANHYILNGDYICEEMTELNLFDNKKRNMFLRLQVPVIFTKN